MKSYAACLIAALTFYTWGILLIAAGKATPGCVFFAIALVRCKKAGKGE